MDKRRRFGNACEVMAARYLEDKKYRILAHQFRTQRGEIDLVAEKDGELVFVEVKARKNLNFGYPEEAVNFKKLRKMLGAAEIYMEQNKLTDSPFRFDIVAILLLKDKTYEIEHLEAVDIGGE